MISINKKDKYLTLSVFFYSLFVFLPVTRILPTGIKALTIAISLVFLVMHDCGNTKRLASDILFMIGINILDFMIYSGLWKSNGVDMLSKNLMLFVFWIPLIYIKSFREYYIESGGGVSKFILALIHIECITTIIGNIRYPYASRQLASTTDISLNRLYQGMNIGGYGFVYALVLLLPYCFYRYKKCHEKKYIFSIALVETTIIFSSYMTAILLSLIVLMLCVIMISGFRKQIIGICLLIVVLILTLHKQIGNLFGDLYTYWVSSGQHILAERARNLSILFLSGSMIGDAGYRNELSNYSWDAFMKSPILGNLTGNFSRLGLHSEFIDLLGGIGIIGVFFLIVVLYGRIKEAFNQLRYRGVFPYAIIAVIALIALGFMNNITAAPELAAVIFVLYPMVKDSDADKFGAVMEEIH